MKIQNQIYTQSCAHITELSLMKRNKEQIGDQYYGLDLYIPTQEKQKH